VFAETVIDRNVKDGKPPKSHRGEWQMSTATNSLDGHAQNPTRASPTAMSWSCWFARSTILVGSAPHRPRLDGVGFGPQPVSHCTR
jgi:hypothetical protein